MDDDGVSGAEAAARYFLELDSYVQATGDTAEWEAMSHETCGYCADRVEQAKEIQRGGYLWSGGDLRVTTARAYAQDSATGIWPIDVEIVQSAGSVADAEGRIVTEIPARTDKRRAEVARKSGHWVFVELAEIPGD